MNIYELIERSRLLNASDVHLSSGQPPVYRIHGILRKTDETPVDVYSLFEPLLNQNQKEAFQQGKDLDFAFSLPGGERERVNLFHQLKQVACTVRNLNSSIPELHMLGLPETLSRLVKEKRGLILVTGPTGSGKSTTLAALVNTINQYRAEHIITVEDPIEYVYPQGLGLIHQREVGYDVDSFASALRSALREDPDILLVGEMRDYETISAALTAAETGHLVLSTLHTNSAASSIERIIDACPKEIQQQVRVQLAGVLKAIITQSLLPTLDEKRAVATEVLIGTDAILNLIRENKTFQINTHIQAGKNEGMHTLNSDLMRLIQCGKITPETAYAYTNNRKDLDTYLGNI